jgi:hypothetical protein
VKLHSAVHPLNCKKELLLTPDPVHANDTDNSSSPFPLSCPPNRLACLHSNLLEESVLSNPLFNSPNHRKRRRNHLVAVCQPLSLWRRVSGGRSALAWFNSLVFHPNSKGTVAAGRRFPSNRRVLTRPFRKSPTSRAVKPANRQREAHSYVVTVRSSTEKFKKN